MSGRRPDGADPDDLVTCLTCGRRYRSLGPHLYYTHRMTGADYRAEHGLPATTALMARDLRTVLSDARREAMTTDPELVTRMRAAALPLEELARRSADARAGTDDLPAVRAARRAGGYSSILIAQQARREMVEATAREAGYASMREAIAATRDLSSSAAAARIGVGASTVKRWRRGS